MNNNVLARILALTFISFFTASVQSQPINQWTEFGLSGKSVNILKHNGAALFAVTDKGIYKRNFSQDQDWILIGFETAWVLNLFIDSTDPNILHVPAKPATSSTILFFRSIDGGGTWLQTSNAILDRAFRIGGKCDNGCVFYAAGEDEKLILRSEDGGTSWTAVNTGIMNIPEGDTSTFAIKVSERHPNYVYASIIQHNSADFTLKNYLLRSTDEGMNWKIIHEYFYGDEGPIIHSIVDSPSDPNVVFAGIGEDLYKSIDGGETNRLIHVMDELFIPTMQAIVIDHIGENHMLVGGSFQRFALYESWDSGEAWRKIQGPTGIKPVLSIVQDLNDPRVFYIGTESGVYQYITSPNANPVQEWPIHN